MTRAQALGLWALASELATDAELEIELVDNYGALLVKANSPHLQAEAHYKLPRAGGRIKLEGEEPVPEVGSASLNDDEDA